MELHRMPIALHTENRRPSQHADFLLAGTVVRHNEKSWSVKSRVCSNPISIDLGVLRTPVDEAPRDIMTALLTVSNHADINVAKR